MTSGNLASKLFDKMRREAAAIRIQKHARRHQARKKYSKLRVSVLALQMTLRTMAARKEYQIRRRNKAATLIQVRFSDMLIIIIGSFYHVTL